MRRERGTPLKVEAKRVTLPDGATGQVLSMALGEAEVPDRSYLAEACALTYDHDTMRIAFAQPKLDGKGLRTLLLIAMTPNAAANFLRSMREMKDPTLVEIAATVGLKAEPLITFPTEEPDQTAPVIANVVAVAVQARETTMDFYHANAFSHMHVRQDKEIYLEPVVRVNVRTALVLSMVERIEQLRAEFPPSDVAVAQAEEAR